MVVIHCAIEAPLVVTTARLVVNVVLYPQPRLKITELLILQRPKLFLIIVQSYLFLYLTRRSKVKLLLLKLLAILKHLHGPVIVLPLLEQQGILSICLCFFYCVVAMPLLLQLKQPPLIQLSLIFFLLRSQLSLLLFNLLAKALRLFFFDPLSDVVGLENEQMFLIRLRIQH